MPTVVMIATSAHSMNSTRRIFSTCWRAQLRRDLKPAPGAAEHGDDDKDHRQRHGVGAAQPAQQLGGAGDLGAHRIRRQGAAGDVLNLAEQQAPTAFSGRTDVLR